MFGYVMLNPALKQEVKVVLNLKHLRLVRLAIVVLYGACYQLDFTVCSLKPYLATLKFQ